MLQDTDTEVVVDLVSSYRDLISALRSQNLGKL